MARIGGSKNNKNRRSLIKNMPIWMRPSGIYGIGLQSVFLLTSEIQIETRNIDTGQALSIKLTDPGGAEKGNIYVRYGEKWDINTFGTLMSFIYKSNKKSNQQSFFVSHGGDYLRNALKNSDILLGDCDDINILKICDEICKFFRISQINGQIDLAEFSIHHLFDQAVDNQYWYYVPKENLELANVQISDHGLFYVFYRGQYINNLWGFFFVSVTINLLDEYADQVLSLNRNKIRKEIEEDLCQRVRRALQDFFKSDAGRDCFEKFDALQKPLLAAEYELQGWERLNNFDGVDWNQAIIFIVEAEKNIRVPINKLVDYDSILYVEDNRSSPPQVLSDNEQQIIIYSHSYLNGRLYPLISKFLQGKLCITYREESMERQVIVFDKSEKPPITFEQMQIYCNRLCNKKLRSDLNPFREVIPFRETIPCLSEYKMLALGSKKYFVEEAFPLDQISFRMLFPLLIKNDRLTVSNFEKLCGWVFDNRYDASITLESIQNSYKKFIAWIDEEVMKDDAKWKEMRGSEFGRVG